MQLVKYVGCCSKLICLLQSCIHTGTNFWKCKFLAIQSADCKHCSNQPIKLPPLPPDSLFSTMKIIIVYVWFWLTFSNLWFCRGHDVGVSEDRVDVIIKPWILTRDNFCSAKPTTRTQPTWTDLILTCDSSSNTQVRTYLLLYHLYTPTNIKAKCFLFISFINWQMQVLKIQKQHIRKAVTES